MEERIGICSSYIHGWKKGLVFVYLTSMDGRKDCICLSYIHEWKKGLVFVYLTSMDGRNDWYLFLLHPWIEERIGFC